MTYKTVWDVKRRTPGDTKRLEDHHQRKGSPKNCDPKRKHLNKVLLGQDKPLDQIMEERDKLGIKYHKKHDGKKYTTHVFAASPEYFAPAGEKEGTWNQARLDAWLEAMVPFLEEEFGDDLLKATLHLDEARPHIHLEEEPTYLKTTKRGTTRWGSHDKSKAHGGGFKGYHGFLDRYAEAVKHLGIERGRQTDGQFQSPSSKADYARKVMDEAKEEKNKILIDRILADQEANSNAAKIKNEAEISATLIIKEAEAKARNAQAYAKACHVGAEAVIDEVVEYRPRTAKKKEGLKAGKNYPKKEEDRKKLNELMKPAWAWIVKLAKKLKSSKQKIEEREEALEARELKIKQNEIMTRDKARNLGERERKISESEGIIDAQIAVRKRINGRGIQR